MEVFLFLATLVQKFELRVPAEDELPTTRGIAAASIVAKPFHVALLPRDPPPP